MSGNMTLFNLLCVLFNQRKRGQAGEFTFELGSPAKATSTVAQSTPVSIVDDLPSHSFLTNRFDDSSKSDVVQPHPSPKTNIYTVFLLSQLQPLIILHL